MTLFGPSRRSDLLWKVSVEKLKLASGTEVNMRQRDEMRGAKGGEWSGAFGSRQEGRRPDGGRRGGKLVSRPARRTGREEKSCSHGILAEGGEITGCQRKRFVFSISMGGGREQRAV